MDVPFDCELNLFVIFQPNSFEEATTHDEWKESMHNMYDALINNGT